MEKVWKVLYNPVGGYIPYRIKNPDEIMHAGNIEEYGSYLKTKEEAQKIADELNSKGD